jgi:glutaredoxin
MNTIFKFPRDYEITPEYLIYGGPNCKFCRLCKVALESYDLKYTYVDIDQYPKYVDHKVLYKDFASFGLIPENYKTIPLVFINGTFIGGYTALDTHLEKLQEESDSEVEMETDF